MEEAASPWQLVTVLGPIIIALVLIYAFVRRRRLTPVEKQQQREAVEEVYKDKDPDDRPPPELRQ